VLEQLHLHSLAYYGELMDSTVDEEEGWELNVRGDAIELGILFLHFFSRFTSLIRTDLLFSLQPSIKRSPKVFLPRIGSWLLQYYLLLCSCL
jgi:hypothetical protein